MPGSPFDPSDVRSIEYETQLLEAIKIQAQATLSPQIAHDAKLSVHMRHMTDHLVLQLQSFLYGMKNEHKTQRVPFEQEVHDEQTIEFVWNPDRLAISSVLLVIVSLIVVSVIPFVGDDWIAGALPFVGFSLALCAGVEYVATRPRMERRKVEFSETVRGVVEIDAESWTMFPENSMVFPDSLGKPQRVIRYSEPRTFYGNE